MSRQKVIDEYSDNYCQELEYAYGEGMMSEGGSEAIDKMFARINLTDKTLLDIGFGLGGAAFYLAEKYRSKVVGVEINPRLVKVAKSRTPHHIKSLVDFCCYQDYLPFEIDEFDIVYSKGVLCHLQDKHLLFKEINKVLKKNGKLIIMDWLSPSSGKWSQEIDEMCRLEDLTIFAQTEAEYEQALLKTGFRDISIEDENVIYSRYNYQIADSLARKSDCEKFRDAIKGYLLIAKAMESGDLLVRFISATKSDTVD